MGIHIVDAAGDWKEVTAVHIVDAAGDWKEVTDGWVAPNDGAIDKQFYANWQYYTGSILKGTWTSGLILHGSTEKIVSVSDAIAPVSITLQMKGLPTEDSGTVIQFKVEHSTDGVNYTALATQTDQFDPYVPAIKSKTFTMDGSTLVKYIRYTLEKYGTGDSITLYHTDTFGEVTAWWG